MPQPTQRSHPPEQPAHAVPTTQPAHRWSDHWGHERGPKRRRTSSPLAAAAALLPGGAATCSVPPQVPCRWLQEGFQAALRSLFPAGLVNFELPVVEDLLLQEPLSSLRRLIEQSGAAMLGTAAASDRDILLQRSHQVGQRGPGRPSFFGPRPYTDSQHGPRQRGAPSAGRASRGRPIPTGYVRVRRDRSQVRSSLDGCQCQRS